MKAGENQFPRFFYTVNQQRSVRALDCLSGPTDIFVPRTDHHHQVSDNFASLTSRLYRIRNIV